MNITTVFALLFSVVAIETLILVFVAIKTPAFTFLISSFTNKDIIYLVGKDRRAEFKLLNHQHGSAVVKKVGVFNLTENSATLEKSTKTAIYFAFRDFAATLDVTYPAIIQEIKESGVKITNIGDIDKILKRIKDETMGNLDIKVKPFKTYKLHELENMFPLNLDPTFIDAQVQGELNKFNKMIKGSQTIMMGVIILLIVAAVAVFILQKAFKGQISTAECQNICSAVGNSVKQQVMLNGTALVG